MATLFDILSATKTLNHDELQVLSSKILDMLKISGDDLSGHVSQCDSCCRCSSERIIKYGKDKNWKQRYKCKDCNSIFYENSYTVTSKSKHSPDVWRRFIELLLSRASLKKCSEICNISVQTAFVWRHKILNVLQKDQDGRVLGGIIETDETYIGISYKGNHKNSRNFTMPRKAYHRGSDNSAQIGSQACVMCAIERNGQTYGEVLGKGQPTIAMLLHAFDSRIMEDSVVIADKARGIKNYFCKRENIELVQLLAHINPKSTSSPPEIKGALHIQNVNNLHYRFKKHLEPYCGVSTKYLNHYLNLFIWIENHKQIKEINLQQELKTSLNRPGSYISRNNIIAMPAIPIVA